MSDEMEQYKAYLTDLGAIGARHESSRGFYITVLAAMLTFLGLAGPTGVMRKVADPFVIVICTAGIAICVLWFFHTRTLAAIYAAKFRRLEEMEEKLPFKLFGSQYNQLKTNGRSYIPITTIECLVSVVFALLFVTSMVLTF